MSVGAGTPGKAWDTSAMENANSNGNGSTGHEMSARAAEVSPHTTPTDSPPPSAPTKLEASIASPPSPQLRALPRRERPRPQFVPSERFRAPEPGQKSSAETSSNPQLPDSTLRVEYTIHVLGGKDVVADVKSSFDMPMSLEEESLPRTDGDFAEVFDKIVVAPLLTQFRVYLRQRYERYDKARQEAAPKTPCQPSTSTPFNQRKPTYSSQFGMPQVEPKPPLPTRPSAGRFPQPAHKNGE
jgi:hypothetical protein